MKILCVLGKYQYGDESRGMSTEYVAFVPTLKKLGHELIHFESWDISLYGDYINLNKALLETVVTFQPDIVLTVQLHYEIWIETIEIITSMENVATISWTSDDSWKYKEVSKFIGTAYNAMTTTYSSTIPLYQKDGIKHVLLTQWGASSKTFTPPISASESTYKVSFVGRAFGNRFSQVQELKSKGIDIHCFGHGWDSGAVNDDEMYRIMRESFISINFANCRGGNQIKARTFEVPGAGGFLLTEYTPGLESFYEIGKEIDVFHSNKELANKINFYLQNPQLRDEIAINGFNRTVRDHSYETRVEDILSFALKAKDEFRREMSISKNEGEIAIDFDELCRFAQVTKSMLIFKKMLLTLCIAVYGKAKGPKVARRIVYEASLRTAGRRTFTSASLPGRLFPGI
jgi:spore maturation protein CgeB